MQEILSTLTAFQLEENELHGGNEKSKNRELAKLCAHPKET